MSTGFFITGTDTDVGKTYVATELINGLRRRQVKVSGFKPVAAGASWIDGILKNQDALDLMQAASAPFLYNEVNPYCFEPAIAPHLAAQQANVVMELSVIQSIYAKHKATSDVVIVEGAGGWKVPLDNNVGFDDLAVALDLPIIIVVGLKLGCINHALLTEAAIINKGCRIAGWIGNDIGGDFKEIDENIKTLKSQMNSQCIGYIKHQSHNEKKSLLEQRNIESLLDYLADFR